MAKSVLASYMQGQTGDPRKPPMPARVLVQFYRSRKGKSAVPGEDTYLGSAYSHRRDRNVASAEVEGVMSFARERQYRMLRTIRFRRPDDDTVTTLGEAAFGSEALGAQPSPPPVAAIGSPAARGMLLLDTETRQVFTVEGVLRDPQDDRHVIVRCGAERTF